MPLLRERGVILNRTSCELQQKKNQHQCYNNGRLETPTQRGKYKTAHVGGTDRHFAFPVAVNSNVKLKTAMRHLQ